jgi:hypothetical protein
MESEAMFRGRSNARWDTTPPPNTTLTKEAPIETEKRTTNEFLIEELRKRNEYLELRIQAIQEALTTLKSIQVCI